MLHSLRSPELPKGAMTLGSLWVWVGIVALGELDLVRNQRVEERIVVRLDHTMMFSCLGHFLTC